MCLEMYLPTYLCRNCFPTYMHASVDIASCVQLASMP